MNWSELKIANTVNAIGAVRAYPLALSTKKTIDWIMFYFSQLLSHKQWFSYILIFSYVKQKNVTTAAIIVIVGVTENEMDCKNADLLNNFSSSFLTDWIFSKNGFSHAYILTSWMEFINSFISATRLSVIGAIFPRIKLVKKAIVP